MSSQTGFPKPPAERSYRRLLPETPAGDPEEGGIPADAKLDLRVSTVSGLMNVIDPVDLSVGSGRQVGQVRKRKVG